MIILFRDSGKFGLHFSGTAGNGSCIPGRWKIALIDSGTAENDPYILKVRFRDRVENGPYILGQSGKWSLYSGTEWKMILTFWDRVENCPYIRGQVGISIYLWIQC